MEKFIKKVVFFAAALVFSQLVIAQEVPSQADQIRIQLWADLDPFPGAFEEENQHIEQFDDPILRENSTLSDEEFIVFEYAINRIRELSPYIMEGMLYGWGFDYVPSDKTRQVEEIFDLSTIQAFNSSENHISYHNPTYEQGKVSVWAWCDRTETQKYIYNQWCSIVYPKVRGVGTGSVSQGFAGVKAAVADAIKNGVREYWRKYEKNKPKEIIGKIFVVGWPRIYIKQGQYVVELDFFMETVRMSRYSYY